MLVKKRIYPRPHDMEHTFQLSMFVAAQRQTIYPILMNDEGLGDPASFNAHPEHTSFAEVNEPNCYPDSHINKIFARFQFDLTKHCWSVDKLEEVIVYVRPYFLAFKEDYLAIDEKSTNEIQDILDLQTEATDRQGYPLWNGTDLTADFGVLATNVPGLTATQTIEGVTGGINQFFDALQYYTNRGKLKAVTGKGVFLNVRRRGHQSYKFRVRLNSKVKAINQYTACGLFIACINSGDGRGVGQNSDNSAGEHINVKALVRYNEWNENFDMTKV